MGRPSKLTPEVQASIVRFVEVGVPLEDAAMASGVSKTTFFRWQQAGARAKRGRYREFWEAVQRARAKGRAAYVTILRVASEKDWKAAAFFLERSDPANWGRRVDVHVPEGVKVAHDIDRRILEDPVASQKASELLAVLAGTTLLLGDAGGSGVDAHQGSLGASAAPPALEPPADGPGGAADPAALGADAAAARQERGGE